MTICSLAGVFLLLLSQNSYCLVPNYYYDSFGPNILFSDEGASVQTASGKDFLSGVSVDTCAEACYTIYKTYSAGSTCDCCNSFAYNPNNKMCYLKKRSNEDDLSRYTGSNGYQSYKFYSDKYYNYFSGLPEKGLPDYVEGYYGTLGPIGLYSMAFISKGNNMNAVYEGNPLKTSQGYDFLTNTTPAKCGDECLKIYACDGFVFNPNQDGGKCFLKTGYPQDTKFWAQFSSDDHHESWTYYWREGRQEYISAFESSDNLEKCFCPCKNEYRCIPCSERSGCTDNA